METLTQEQLVIRLIRDHLISTKLVSGLNDLGLIADDYNLYLGDTIFLLMGFKNCRKGDEIFETILLGNSEKVKKINFSSDTEDLDKLSEEIYCELVFAKNMM